MLSPGTFVRRGLRQQQESCVLKAFTASETPWLLNHVGLLPDTTVLLDPFQNREASVLLDTFAKDRLSTNNPVALAALHRTTERQTANHAR